MYPLQKVSRVQNPNGSTGDRPSERVYRYTNRRRRRPLVFRCSVVSLRKCQRKTQQKFLSVSSLPVFPLPGSGPGEAAAAAEPAVPCTTPQLYRQAVGLRDPSLLPCVRYSFPAALLVFTRMPGERGFVSPPPPFSMSRSRRRALAKALREHNRSAWQKEQGASPGTPVLTPQWYFPPAGAPAAGGQGPWPTLRSFLNGRARPRRPGRKRAAWGKVCHRLSR